MKLQKLFLYTFLGLVSFLFLVLFNYFKAQEALRSRGESPLGIEITSFPETVKVGDSANFVWQVDTAPDLSTPYTTIYWSYESSPSALTKSDSPLAVKYPHFALDYTSGRFMLPSTFDQNILFDQPGKVFFRAYARVGADHLWSPEASLVVAK